MSSWYEYISRNISVCPGSMNIYPGIYQVSWWYEYIFRNISRCPGGMNIYPGIYLGVLVV